MDYSELVSAISRQTNVSQNSVREVLKSTKDVIINAAKHDEKVKWTGFCTFEKRIRPPRKYHSPKAGEYLVSQGSATLRVKISSTVKEELS